MHCNTVYDSKTRGRIQLSTQKLNETVTHTLAKIGSKKTNTNGEKTEFAFF